jgi:alkaline phosphatase
LRRALVALALAAAGLAAGFWLGRETGFAAAGGRHVPVVAAPVGGLEEPPAAELPPLADAPVRSVVLLVPDGLGISQVSAGALRAFGPGGRFLFERFPVSGLVATEPAGGVVSKSDAAATALASGVKTVNGRVGTAPDGARLPSLLEAARAAGMPAGLVTSTAIYDATPAAFAAHVDRRRDYRAIVDHLAASDVELLAGGGLEWFLPAREGGARDDERDLVAEARARGVTVATDVEALSLARSLPLWALFPGRRLGEEPARPAVAELAGKALELLDAEARRRGTGFFLLVEEEGVDTWGHANDLDGMARALLRFDAAVAAAARFAARDGGTLLVVVGDHATGGPLVDEPSSARALQVVWATDDHSGERVPLYAYGPAVAAARFTGTLDNTDVARRLAAALGLRLGVP